jgi:hypothetical protein
MDEVISSDSGKIAIAGEYDHIEAWIREFYSSPKCEGSTMCCVE